MFGNVWNLMVYSSFIFLITVGSASSPPQSDPKTPQNPTGDVSKNASSTDNRLPDLSPVPTSRPTPPPENCSERIQVEKRDCPSNRDCSDLGRECLQCDFNCTCVYGSTLTVMCQPKDGVICQGAKKFRVEMRCQYCYQTEPWQHTCLGTDQCLAVSSPRATFTSNCTVNSDVLCMGNRVFPKKLPCNWTSGYQWSTALILSITLGGFGADRFYLGHWQEGIGKLFSFGGLGVWTIIDVILIAIRYIGPADGSLYI